MDAHRLDIARGQRSAAALAQALVDARDYTQRAYRHLTPAQQLFPQLPVVNPPRWELGHIGWFQEFWCRRHAADDPRGERTVSRIAAADSWWDSARIPHASRWSLPLPAWAEIDRFLAATLDDTLALLADSRDGDRYFFELALLHEDMHGEALLMTLQTLALPLPPGSDGSRISADAAPPAPGDVTIPGGRFTLGATRDAAAHRFVFDNEKWGHEVALAPFAMARRCVSNDEFAQFVDAHGYLRREYWSDAGWQWRHARDAAHPAYWRRAATGWEQRRFADWLPLAGNEPVMHVNAHEAEAYCAWAGRRLPTEAEWECAAIAAGTSPHPNLDFREAGPVGVDTSEPGLAHLIGNVWEWTASGFAPYPGFAADPYAEYSAPWFGDHRVIRGGSFATRARLVHERMRNFYLPTRHDMFVGFRTCALAA
jgi:iron(II)-dependent oxidoreductase